ncbi:MAG: DUF2089 family protein [Verrucomicrobiales bacterium]|nr:DUF2089 family protein [Verrucomicrobiales bacterium]
MSDESVTKDSSRPNWLNGLSSEDLNFLKRFLLNSGSLKKMAAEYDVSYPTVRLRLDRLIQKVQIIEEATIDSEFERQLKLLLADQAISSSAYKTLLNTHRNELKQKQSE